MKKNIELKESQDERMAVLITETIFNVYGESQEYKDAVAWLKEHMQVDILDEKKEFNGTVSTIQSTELLKDKNLLDKIISLVIKVYDKNDADKFLQEIQDTPDIFITFMMIGDTVIGLGCISESHISFGVYELFWNMLDEPYRGNGWGKIFVEEGIKWIKRNRKGLNSPNDIIAVTAKPWHLKRCGFEVIKQLNNDEVLMYFKID